MSNKVLLFGLVLLGACGEEPHEWASADPDATLRVFCDVDCVEVEVQGSYVMSQIGGRVYVQQGANVIFAYDIDGSDDVFGSWAASEWLLVDCHDDLVATYGLGAGLTATVPTGTGVLLVSSGSSPIIRVDTQLTELHQEPKI